MTSMPLTEARNHLSELVEQVSRTHERIEITRHGHVDAILISPDDLESLEETLDILSTPGALDEIRQAQAEQEAGLGVPIEEVAAMLRRRRQRSA
jgi:antitoxin YefM